MWTIVNNDGQSYSTNRVADVHDAIDMGWRVYRNGKRVW